MVDYFHQIQLKIFIQLFYQYNNVDLFPYQILYLNYCYYKFFKVLDQKFKLSIFHYLCNNNCHPHLFKFEKIIHSRLHRMVVLIQIIFQVILRKNFYLKIIQSQFDFYQYRWFKIQSRFYFYFINFFLLLNYLVLIVILLYFRTFVLNFLNLVPIVFSNLVTKGYVYSIIRFGLLFSQFLYY